MNGVPVFVLLACTIGGALGWQGHSYWNNRYQGLGIDYESGDSYNGLYSVTYGYLGYQHHRTCSGCSCTESKKSISCSSTSVTIRNYSFNVTTNATFASNTQEIIIRACTDFITMADDTFDALTGLISLSIQETSITTVPDLRNTRIQKLNLAYNKIRLTTLNFYDQQMPDTLTHLVLTGNEMHWIPPQFLSGPQLRIVSLGFNQLTQFATDVFGSRLDSLTYLGLEGNQIKTISKRSLQPLASAPYFMHLNISNNEITTVQSEAFKQLPELRVLEMHRNSLTSVPWNTLTDLPNLLHLDLNYNYIGTMRKRALENLPNLREIRLHSQQTRMTAIAYDAWINIGANLKSLFVSSNSLQTFPHQVMLEDSYPALWEIHADNNQISNITEFGSEAYLHDSEWLQKRLGFTPFATSPSVTLFKIHNNQLRYANTTDLCEMPLLEYLYIQNNYIQDNQMDSDAFACLPNLVFLEFSTNWLEQVPEAFKNSSRLPAITNLYLDSNRLTVIETDSFKNVSTLTYLSLTSNYIITIEDDAFPEQIQTLQLQNNQFRFRNNNPFHDLSALTTLRLDNNQIYTLPDNAFRNCTALVELYINSNMIPYIRKSTFADCPLTGSLYFNDNEIGWIEDGTFSHVETMSYLTLANNKLSLLPMNRSFCDISISRYLDLRNNRIVALPSGTFSNMSVGYSLYMSNNYIASVETGAFDSVSVSHQLNLQSNRIYTVETLAFNDVYANQLYLSSNLVEEIQPYAFNSSNFNYVYLQSMYYTTIPTYAFNDMYVGYLYLNSGQLTTVQRQAFYNLRVGGNMHLNNNQITTISEPMFGPGSYVGSNLYLSSNGLKTVGSQAFADMTSVNTIHFSSNSLVSYPAALTLVNPYSVYIDSNQLEEIPPSMLDGKTNLRTLSIRYNRITHVPAFPRIYLYTLNLEYNDIETLAPWAFNDLTHLSSLNLRGNPLSCQCNTVETLRVKQTAINDADCSSPSATAGTTFEYSQQGQLTYFEEVDHTMFLCATLDLMANSSSAYDIDISWNQPLTLYANLSTPVSPPYTCSWSALYPLCSCTEYNSGLTSPELSFAVSCVSAMAATLSTVVVDGCGSSQNLSTSFNASDGVQPGIEYECSVKVTADGYTSGKSPVVSVVTPFATSGSSSSNPSDLVLDITYYDFGYSHADFDDMSDIDVPTPSYAYSPYEAWLSISSDPTSDTFSEWYREVAGSNYKFKGAITLVAQTGTIKRYYSSEFFPVDGLGYVNELQADCNNYIHNFGFTSAIRAGLKFSGTEKITLGGGEALWFYLNKVLLVEILTPQSSATMPCYRVDLSPAAQTGGGSIVPEAGVVSGGACTGLVAVPSAAVTLELRVGEVYHFSVFHAEVRTCTSWYFLEVEDAEFSDPNDPEALLPADYAVTVSEDFHIDGILETIALNDAFSIGPYDTTLYKGNEARHFTFKDNSTANILAGVAPAVTQPTYINVTTNDGTTLSYIECLTPPSLTPEPNVTGTEYFYFTTPAVLLTLATSLDREVADKYYLRVEVVDGGTSLTGTVAITVFVDDVNDNCPITNDSSIVLSPEPILREGPITIINATDADINENAELLYVVSQINYDPPLTYNSSSDLWREVYPNYTVMSFDVLVTDNGTSKRATAVTFNVTISNYCLVDAEYGAMEFDFLFNSTGEMFLRIPRYYIQNFLCEDDIGIVEGWVLDVQLSASSSLDKYSLPRQGRLNTTADAYSTMLGGWVAGVTDTSQYYQVDMWMPYKFTKLYLQGRQDAAEWVTSFRLYQTYDENGNWTLYTDNTGQNIFLGTTGQDTVATLVLDPPIFSQFLRINPQSWQGGNISLRLELAGCSQDEQRYYDTSCLRCEASYYCEGEGVRKVCGRCDPPQDNSTCGRHPTEHSFGLAKECTTCPTGWLCDNGYASVCPNFTYSECNSTYCPSSCTDCGAGYACRDGIRYLCGQGTMSDGMKLFCESCPGGTYQDQSGQSTCIPCAAGYYSSTMKSSCSPCPEDSYSTGISDGCQACSGAAQCPCMSGSVCFEGADCRNTGSGGYECGDCPPGYQGNGVTCTDVDECVAYDPCWNISACINTYPGYQCLECPDGFTSTYEDALGWNITKRVFVFMNQVYAALQVQTCQDIDECQTGTHTCHNYMPCINTIGSYYCSGVCEDGYMGNNIVGCYLSDFCQDGKHSCHANADCIYTGPGTYRCQCHEGYAGNGEICYLDYDHDGHPDFALPCTDWGCTMDNCALIPNSVQEDTDADQTGDTCDDDDDNDAVPDSEDNCPFVSNLNQTDTDGDGIGDACDNCVSLNNTDQSDNDSDGLGDDCDDDDDNDGVLDVSDNCVFQSNPGQENSGDSDGVGDACDNCIYSNNDAQTDTDVNGYGDACDTVGGSNQDTDGDSVLDFIDNCATVGNPDQSDIDGDSIGDVCDDDIDGDGVTNLQDNCPYFSNPLQQDLDGDKVGDDCASDSDGDGVMDRNDTCPYNPAISVTSFARHFTVNLDTLVTDDPTWRVHSNGAEVSQLTATKMPTMLIGEQRYGDIEYRGTWFVQNTSAEDYVGLVFGYVNSRRFYVVMWKRINYNYQRYTNRAGLKGIQIKLVDTTSGPSTTVSYAIWHSDDTSGHVELLWHEPEMQGWSPYTAYRWHLIHRPSTGYMSIKVYKGATLLVDSGPVYNARISGGRVGVFQFGEYSTIWSNLRVECLTRNQAVYFDGVGSYIQLAPLTELVRLHNGTALKMDESFTFEAWLKTDQGYSAGPYPVFCTLGGNVCLWIQDGQVQARYGQSSVASSSTLTQDQWYNVIFRYSIAERQVTLFINGVSAATGSSVVDIDWGNTTSSNDTVMYLGRGNGTYFQGAIDEVRIYRLAVLDADIMSHVTSQYLETPRYQNYLSVQLKMEEDVGATTLTNEGRLSLAPELSGNCIFVDSAQDYQFFHLLYPNN